MVHEWCLGLESGRPVERVRETETRRERDRKRDRKRDMERDMERDIQSDRERYRAIERQREVRS